MPGATSLGINYPLQGEVVDDVIWHNMANDIDGLLSVLDNLRDTAVSRPSASISGGSTSLASATDGVLSGFTDEDWDTGGYANLGVNNDRLTIPAGIFWVSCDASISAVTTLTSARIGVQTGSTIWGMQMHDLSGNTGTSLRASGLVHLTASSFVRAFIRWTGTGGPASFLSQNLAAYKVRDIADV